MLILLIGPPGVGKGSQLLLLQKALTSKNIKFKYYIFGDEFRRLAKTDKAINQKITNGDLIDDDNVNSIFDMLKINPTEITIIDGYPRSLNQAKHLNKYKHIIPIFFYTTFEILKNRLLHRRQCQECNYGNNANSAKCYKCNSTKLTTRKDDNISAIKHRFEEYESITKPIQDYFSSYKHYLEIEANKEFDTIHNIIITHIMAIL
ncbi:MAG: nucleoside monophosphate kinase [Pseudomonadota bacterium]